MRYLLLIISDEEVVAATPQSDIDAILERHARFSDELHAAGAWVGSSRLRPPEEATTVRLRGGKQLVVDGPFAESKEVLGGFYEIEAPSMKAATEWAKKLPVLANSSVEVRQVWGDTSERRWRET